MKFQHQVNDRFPGDDQLNFLGTFSEVEEIHHSIPMVDTRPPVLWFRPSSSLGELYLPLDMLLLTRSVDITCVGEKASHISGTFDTGVKIEIGVWVAGSGEELKGCGA
jgi:hypothetical protein